MFNFVFVVVYLTSFFSPSLSLSLFYILYGLWQQAQARRARARSLAQPVSMKSLVKFKIVYNTSVGPRPLPPVHIVRAKYAHTNMRTRNRISIRGRVGVQIKTNKNKEKKLYRYFIYSIKNSQSLITDPPKIYTTLLHSHTLFTHVTIRDACTSE